MRVDFSSKAMEAGKWWHSIFQVLKENNCEPRIIYPANMSFRDKGEIKTFSGKRKHP